MMRFVAAFLLLTFAPAAFAEDVWVVADTPSKRFPDADTLGPTFKANTQLEVLYHDKDRVRVRAGDDYGWVAAKAVTATAPPGAQTDENAAADKVLEQLRAQGVGAKLMPGKAPHK